MEPVIGENEKNAEHLVHKQQHKRKRSNTTSLNLECSKETTDGIPARAIGMDGHYYVCVNCDKDGELLCCDSCACTYHLQCLNPPLESTPEGGWQCPNCDDADLSIPIINFKRSASNKRFSKNKENASHTCSLCSKTNKILELSEDEAVKPKSPKFNSEEEESLSTETDKGPMENQGGTSVCNADSCGTSTQKPPNNKPDKLLILREVLLESMKDLDKSKKNNDDKTNAVPQLDAEHTQAALAWKEKYSKLRVRQKERLCKGTLLSFGSVAPKQSSDLQILRYSERAPLYALPYRWGGARDLLSSVSLRGQNITIPNTSLRSKFSSTVMEGALSFTAGTSSDRNADSMIVVETPTGLLKRKSQIIAWSEEELDALWVGVRRYGQGNWDTILGDPSLKCLKNKPAEDLSTRWNKELRKFFQPAPSSSLSSSVPNRLVPPLNDYSYATRHPVSMANQSVMWRSSIPPSAASFWCDNTKSTSSRAPQGSTNSNKEQVFRELLLGGHFPLPNPNFGLNQNMNAGHCSRETQTLPKPPPPIIVVDDDDDDDDSDSSEKTESH